MIDPSQECPFKSDPSDLEALTPNHILFLKRNPSVSPAELLAKVVRRVNQRTATGHLMRDVSMLCMLEEDLIKDEQQVCTEK